MKAVPNARVRVEKSSLQLVVCGERVASTNLNQFKNIFRISYSGQISCASTKHHRHGANRMATHRGYHIPSKDWKSWSLNLHAAGPLGFCVSGASWVTSSAYKSALKFFSHNSQKSNAGNVCVRQNLLRTKAGNATSSSQAFVSVGREGKHHAYAPAVCVLFAPLYLLAPMAKEGYTNGIGP